jgi:predicted HD phosphohydrolase
MSPGDCQAFERNPHFVDALKLRVWDDLGKHTSWFDVSKEEALEHLSALMTAVAARHVTKI